MDHVDKALLWVSSLEFKQSDKLIFIAMMARVALGRPAGIFYSIRVSDTAYY
jgi:hypothetical protein